MKRKSLAVLVLAMILAVGTVTFSSLAAERWELSGNTWVYYDANGSKVSNEWKKGADNLWRYLNDKGEMAINSWIETTYFVDSNGILVTDKWQKLSTTMYGGSSNSDEYKWYYFGSSGKAITDTWKKIDNKWYYFDTDGVMLTGWILDNMYYTANDGSMRTGWQKLVPPGDESYDENRETPAMEDNDGKKWYYFSSTGKKFVPDTNAAENKEHKIEGSYYCFNSEGAMQTGWVNVGSDSAINAAIDEYKYFGDDGKAKTGWLTVEPPENLTGYDGDVEWFYFSSNGTPKSGPKRGDATTSDLVKINGITYLFNDKGNPSYGLQKLQIGNSSEHYTAYYFGDKKTSSVVKGKRKVEEGDGTISDFYFTDSGRGYTGVKDSHLYYMGKLQRLQDASGYTVISISDDSSGHTNYVVNVAGKVAKSTTVRSADGLKYKTNANGVLLKINDEDPGSGLFDEPILPVFQERD